MNPAFQNQSFNKKTLNDLSPGDCGVIAGLTCQGALRRRLLDLGFVAGAAVTCVGASPHKDPKAYLIRGAVIALRAADSRAILLERESTP